MLLWVPIGLIEAVRQNKVWHLKAPDKQDNSQYFLLCCSLDRVLGEAISSVVL